MNTRAALLPLVLVMMLGVIACDADDHRGVVGANPKPVSAPATQPSDTMKIKLTFGDTTLTATLDDNQAARDFVSLLPMTLTLKDYATNEKISDLPRKLSTEGAPSGYEASAGDITYYAPWGNLALFHKDGDYAPGLVRLGSISSGIEALRREGPLERIEE
jgi:hypothetical protein